MADLSNLPQSMYKRWEVVPDCAVSPWRAHSTPDPDDVPPSQPDRGPDDEPEPDAPPVQEPDRPHPPMSARQEAGAIEAADFL